MTRWSVLLAVALVLPACSNGDDDAEPATPSTVDATPDVPCLDPPEPHEVPDGGWLHAGFPSDDGSFVDDEEQRTSSPGLTVLAERVRDAAPDGFTVSRTEELFVPDACVTKRFIEVVAPDGAAVFVSVRQLRDTASLFNVPTGQATRAAHGEHGVLVTDDFNGQGNRSTALAISDTGLWVLVIARGANSPDLSGWPTTRPPTSAAGEPGPAPLTVEQAVALAIELSE